MTTTGQPWLSLIISTYQGEKYLPIMLDSIPLDELDDVEIIVVDDGSTDGTLAILDAYTAKLPMRVFDRAHCGNWVANTNYAMGKARGRYISMLHQDDIWLKNRLSTLRQLTVDFPHAGFFVSPSLYIDASGKRIGKLTPPLARYHNPISSQSVLRHLIVQNLFSIPAPFFSHEIALTVGKMDEDLWFLADWDYWARLIAQTETVYCSEPLSAFRVHPTSQTSTRTDDSLDMLRQYHTVIQKIASNLSCGEQEKTRAVRAAQLNAELSTALAACSHGDRSMLGRALVKILWQSPMGWHRFLRDSRILERTLPRIKLNRKRSRHNE